MEKGILRLTITIFLLFTRSVMLAQEFITRDTNTVNAETDTLTFLLQSDSIDVFIEERACWAGDYAVIIRIRKISNDYKISYLGGRPVKSVNQAHAGAKVEKIKKTLLSIPSQPIPLSSAPYFEIYIQTIDAQSKYRHLPIADYEQKIDKIIREILGI
jgi:hypothetical protein